MYLTTYFPNSRASNRKFHGRVITGDSTAAHATGAKIKDLILNKSNVIFMEEGQIMIH